MFFIKNDLINAVFDDILSNLHCEGMEFLCPDGEAGAAKRRRVETEFPSKMLMMEIAYSAWLIYSTRQPETGRTGKRVYIIYGRAKNASG